MRGEADGPGEFAGVAVAAPVEEAAEPADGDPEGERRGDGVEHRQEREPAPPSVVEETDRPAQDAPVENDPALPDLEDLPEAVDPIAPVLVDVEPPGADEAADEDIERHVVDEVGVELLATGSPGGDVHRAEEGEEEHQPVAEDLHAEPGDLEQDLTHESPRAWRSVDLDSPSTRGEPHPGRIALSINRAGPTLAAIRATVARPGPTSRAGSSVKASTTSA